MLNTYRKVQGISVTTDNKELTYLHKLNSDGFRVANWLTFAFFLIVFLIMETSFFQNNTLTIMFSLVALELLLLFFFMGKKSDVIRKELNLPIDNN